MLRYRRLRILRYRAGELLGRARRTTGVVLREGFGLALDFVKFALLAALVIAFASLAYIAVVLVMRGSVHWPW